MISSKELSRIALGTMQFLWTTSEQESYTILNAYYELGGNIIDTADMYTNWVTGLHGGEAETIVGKWMKRKKNRDNIFLTTKVRAKMWEGKDGEGLSSKHIVKAIEKSLKRLQTEYVDLYLAHWSDTNTPIEESLLAFQSLIKEGKVRFIGCSNYTEEELAAALKVGEKLGIKYTFLEAYYNLIDRKTYEEQYVPLVKKYNLQVMPYGSLAGGFLTGAYRNGKVIPQHVRAEFAKEKMIEKHMTVINYLEKLGKKYNKTISQMALGWLISNQSITAPIMGADSKKQIEENFINQNIELEQEDMKALNDLTAH